MIKTGDIKKSIIENEMYAMRLFENLQTYDNTLEYLKTQDNSIELINDVISNVKNLKKLYEYYSSIVLTNAITNGMNEHKVQMNSWIDLNINELFNKILGEKNNDKEN